MKTIHPNARFWEFINDDWVKITLKPDQKLSYSSGGPTEEGFHRESINWEYEAEMGRVIAFIATEGRDCDGRYGNYGKYCALIKELKFKSAYQDDGIDVYRERVKVPLWNKLQERIYDQYAQAMGY